jgi:hypothetical protein
MCTGGGHQGFEGKYCLHLEGRCEMVCTIFVRNVDNHVPEYTATLPIGEQSKSAVNFSKWIN